MAYLIFSEDMNTNILTIDDMIAYDAKLGVGSVIRPFLIKKGYVLADMKKDAVAAQVADADSKRLASEAGVAKTQRDNLFNPAFSNIEKFVGELKIDADGNIRQVGDWGVPITASGAVKYPSEFAKRVILAKAVLAKHAAMVAAGGSPLDVYISVHNIDVAALAADIVAAEAADKEFRTKEANSISATADRNKLWASVMKKLKAIGERLMSLYNDDPTKVGLWGYNVSLDAKPSSLRKVKVPGGKTKITTNVVIGGKLTVTGNTTLIVVNGNKKKGLPTITLKPGEIWKVLDGYSTIKTTNTDALEDGEFTVEVHS